jgi:ATP-dependent RNA helicase DeaD
MRVGTVPFNFKFFREGGKEESREGGRERRRGKEGRMEGGRKKKRGREGRREGGRGYEGRREGERQREREGGREVGQENFPYTCLSPAHEKEVEQYAA